MRVIGFSITLIGFTEPSITLFKEVVSGILAVQEVNILPSVRTKTLPLDRESLYIVATAPDSEVEILDLPSTLKRIGAQIPILILAVPADRGDFRLRALEAGFDEILSLPLDRAEVSARLRTAAMLLASHAEILEAKSTADQLYALIALGSNDGLWNWNLRSDIVRYSPRLAPLLGLPPASQSCPIETWLSCIVSEDRDWVEAMLKTQLDNPSSDFQIEYRVQDSDGKIRWMQCRGTALTGGKNARVSRIAGSLSDITPRKEAEQALRASEERYALAIMAAKDGLWDWDLRTNSILFTPRWKQMIGCKPEEIGTDPEEWFGRVNPDDLIWLQAVLEAQIAAEEDPFQIEYRIRHADASERWMLCHGLTIRDPVSDQAIRIVGSQSDITERKQAEQQVLHDAFHDITTGLPNRTLFLDRLTQTLRRADGRLTDCAVLIIDINRFASLVNSLSPVQADQLLREIGNRLRQTVLSTDTLARLDWASFGFLMLDVLDEATLHHRAKAIHARFKSAIELPGVPALYVSVRIGAAMPRDNQLAEELIRDAWRALAFPGANAEKGVALFTSGNHESDFDSLAMESDLRAALEAGGQLQLHYQPIVDLQSKGLVGFEALMRWRHPMAGMVPPLRFIPLSEESQLIVPLGIFAFEQACRQVKSWRKQLPNAEGLFINVNVSGVQIQDPDFVDRIAEVLNREGTSANALKLEITESVVLSDVDKTLSILSRLKAMGLRLAIDDFGTGYSSLSYLHQFHFDAIKIDQSFVRAMRQRQENGLIIRMIAELGCGLGCEIIAEGIESESDAEKLTSLGCMFGQGYYFGVPSDPDTIERKYGKA